MALILWHGFRNRGVEKGPKSQNITQALIDAAGGLNVCGTTITNTDAGNCTGVSIQSLQADCNAECVGDPSDRTMGECIDEIDCFNNGGEFCFDPPGSAGSTRACKAAAKTGPAIAGPILIVRRKTALGKQGGVYFAVTYERRVTARSNGFND
jgi:hypothetical protein